MLNAFRHHGLYRRLKEVKTPPKAPKGAQRLSASRIISAGVQVAHVGDEFTCSTPFGITDYIGSGR